MNLIVWDLLFGTWHLPKAKKVEQYNVSPIDNAETELTMLVDVYTQGQKQALLLNGDLAAQVFKQSRGKNVELTQERFEQYWLGSTMQGKDSANGFGEDAYIHYFWQQCPDILTYLPQLKSVYQGLYQSIQKVTSKTKGERT